MEILLWLLPAALATGVAMLVAGYVGRERADDSAGDSAPDPRRRATPHREVTWDADEFVSRARTSRAAPKPVPAEPTASEPRRTA